MRKSIRVIRHFYYSIISVKFGAGSKIFIALTILLLPLAMLENYEVWILKFHLNPISKENYIWFCSTLAQSMAAIFGIGGMFAAYIFQILRKNIVEEYDKAKIVVSQRLVSTLTGSKSNDEFLAKLNEHIESPERFNISPDTLNRLREVKKSIEAAIDLKYLLTWAFKAVIYFMTSVILLSLIALPFSNYLSILTCGFLYAICILILTLIAVMKMVRFVIASITM